jgi:hypothetical protein
MHNPADEWREKLKVMLANPLRSPDVAWPKEAVYSFDRSTIVGYPAHGKGEGCLGDHRCPGRGSQRRDAFVSRL